jgi:salicylate hydroxylase
LNRKCVGLTQTANYVELHFEAGQSVAAKLVIGADGLHSVIRESLFGAAKPQFCGITAWRGVVPIERVPPTIAAPTGSVPVAMPYIILCVPGPSSMSLACESARAGR